MKYREVLRYVPIKLPETTEEKNIIKEIVRHVDKILEIDKTVNSSDVYGNLMKKTNLLLFALYRFNSSEIEQIYEFLNYFCPSCPTSR